jgi:hypothetical protein
MANQSNIIEITGNIKYNTYFSKNFCYVIIGEVHVLEGVTLTVENNVVIQIRNGISPTSSLNKSALIFDTGSSLIMEYNAYFVACDDNNERSIIPDNGGLWFVGSMCNSTKEGIQSRFSPTESNFIGNKIFAFYLGSKDPLVQVNKYNNEPSADNDGITFLGVGNNEWNISDILIQESGDNAIDIVDSYVTMNSVEVYYPGEDGINLQGGKINIIKNFKVLVYLTNVFDRDIFDLEVKNGYPYIRLERNCYVEIVGIFGDQLDLVSNDLPQPTEGLYNYSGVTVNGQSYIYSGIFV